MLDFANPDGYAVVVHGDMEWPGGCRALLSQSRKCLGNPIVRPLAPGVDLFRTEIVLGAEILRDHGGTLN